MFDGPKKTSRLDLEQAISNENLTNTTHEVIPPTRIDMFLEREVENKYLYKMCYLGDNPKYEVASGHKVPAKKVIPLRFLRDQCASLNEIYSYENLPTSSHLQSRETLIRRKILSHGQEEYDYLPTDTEEVVKLWGKESALGENAIQGFDYEFKKDLKSLLKTNTRRLRDKGVQQTGVKMIRLSAFATAEFLRKDAKHRYIYDKTKLNGEEVNFFGCVSLEKILSLRFLRDQCASFKEIYAYKNFVVDPYPQTRIFLMTRKNEEQDLLSTDSVDIVKLWGKETELGEKAIQGFSEAFQVQLNKLFKQNKSKYAGFSQIFRSKLNSIFRDRSLADVVGSKYMQFTEELQSKQEKITKINFKEVNIIPTEETQNILPVSGRSIQFKEKLNNLLLKRINQGDALATTIPLVPLEPCMAISTKKIGTRTIREVQLELEATQDKEVSGFSKIFQNKLNKILQARLEELKPSAIPMQEITQDIAVEQSQKSLLTAYDQTKNLEVDIPITQAAMDTTPLTPESDHEFLKEKLANLTI